MKKLFLLALLILGFVQDILAQGGGPCTADSQCNSAANGGFCTLGTNSCTCINNYTGANCQTASSSSQPASSSTSTSASATSNLNRTVLLLTLATSFFIYLRNKQSRELDQNLYNAVYRSYMYR